MDFADIKRKAEAAREFRVDDGARWFTLRLPTDHDVSVEAARARDAGGAGLAATVQLTRALVERAVVAWGGVTCEMLAPSGGEEAAEVVPGAVGLLLDAEPALQSKLFEAFIERQRQRREKQEAAAKN